MAAKKKAKPKAPKKDKVIAETKPQGHNLTGRPKGVKNKSTLFKEAMKQGFEDKLIKDGFKVFDAVVQKAIGNPIYDTNGKVMKDKDSGEILRHPADMTAAKMILDRVVPVSKAVDINASSLDAKGGITIHIEKLVAETGRVGDEIDAEFTETDLPD